MNCKTCQKTFIIDDEDRTFYYKMEVPEPTSCPECRRQRRLSWRCERAIHPGICDLCKKPTLSSYQGDKPFPVYCTDCWYTDKWDQLTTGRDFDFSRNFFEQYYELQKKCPRPSRFVQNNVDSDYCNTSTNAKGCYLSFAQSETEDCYYSHNALKSFNLVNCTEMFSCERCYDCLNCDNCYGLIGSIDCRGCRDSFFLFDCSGCHDCFGCTNLRNQSYCLWNKQLSEKEYLEELNKIDLSSRQIYLASKKRFNSLRSIAICQYRRGHSNDSTCSGDYLIHCKGVKQSFNCNNVEDSKYITRLVNSKDCFDVDHFGFLGLEMAYECSSCGNNSTNLKFCNQCWDGNFNLEYCDICISCKNCFGCVGLIKKEYCIFNKQYTPEEYQSLKAKIIKHMKETGEYGEFFPMEYSHLPYNDSYAQDFYPLTKNEATTKNLRWAEDDTASVPATAKLPDNSQDLNQKITKEIFACTTCGKNFKLILKEINFYQDLKVPASDCCYQCRLQERMHNKNPRTLYSRQCDKCSKGFETTYAPNRPEKVYCEECYQTEIY